MLWEVALCAVTSLSTIALAIVYYRTFIRGVTAPLFLTRFTAFATGGIGLSMGSMVLVATPMSCYGTAILGQVTSSVTYITITLISIFMFELQQQTKRQVKYGNESSGAVRPHQAQNDVKRSMPPTTIPEQRSSISLSHASYYAAQEAAQAQGATPGDTPSSADGGQISKRYDGKVVSVDAGRSRKNQVQKPVRGFRTGLKLSVIIVFIATSIPIITSIVLPFDNTWGSSENCTKSVEWGQVKWTGLARNATAFLVIGSVVARLGKSSTSLMFWSMIRTETVVLLSMVENTVMITLHPDRDRITDLFGPYFILGAVVIVELLVIPLWKSRSISHNIKKADQDHTEVDKFERFLRTDTGFAAFKRHLVGEYSVENLLCWKRIEEYEELVKETLAASPAGTTIEEVLKLESILHCACLVYHDFFHLDAPLLVNLSSHLLNQYKKVFGESIVKQGEIDLEKVVLTEAIFAPVKDNILKLMLADPFFRFRQSPQGKLALSGYSTKSKRLSKFSTSLAQAVTKVISRHGSKEGL